MNNFFISTVSFSIVAVIIILIILAVKAIRKKPFKKAVISLGVCAGILVASVIGGVSTSVPKSAPVEQAAQQEEKQALLEKEKPPSIGEKGNGAVIKHKK